MRLRSFPYFSALAAAGLLLAACGGGSNGGGIAPTSFPSSTPTLGPSNPPSQSPPPTPSPVPSGLAIADSIAGANGVGSQIANTTIFAGSPTGGSGSGGVCNVLPNGGSTLFYRPDRNNDANSLQTRTFFDSACQQLQSDAVRIFHPQTPNTETVNLTTTINPSAGATSGIITLNQTLSYSNTTFDINGFPNFTTGYNLSARTQTLIDHVDTIDSADEILSEAQNGAVVPFCSNAVGYKATGSLSGQTYAWSGQTDPTNGSRTTNTDGSVTVSEVHLGTPYNGSVGAFTIVAGTPNQTCPIGTPEFTLSGGTASASYRLPISMTFLNGTITNVTVMNATFSANLTLNVVTSKTLPPSDPNFIVGTMKDSHGTTVSTFNVNAAGKGSLTITLNSSNPYAIQNFRVLH
ncbi:MAG: hypothetical protein M3R51_00990 [Candidatus Eremiobacteraeota bacterium]|nr:hypothetical protein [Candidatus Eremiobacteraeota bacterium]